MEKNTEKDKIPTNEDFLKHSYVASATDCTGFAPAPIDTYSEAQNYNAMYGVPLGPTPLIKNEKKDEKNKKHHHS